MIKKSTQLAAMLLALSQAFMSAAIGQSTVELTVFDSQEDQTTAEADQAIEPTVGESYIDNGCNSCCGGGCYGGCGTGCGGVGFFGLGGGCCGGLLGYGWVQPSDHGFDDFISPMTNPLFFEDPRALTEARAIFANHRVPLAAGGGDVRYYALQLRARLSENVSLIATKDGYIDSSNPLVGDGWADIAAGLKFNLIRDTCCQRMLSGGFTFDMPTGETAPLQGNGDGELHLFLTGGRKIGCRGHWLSAAGVRAPFNSTDESTSSYWSNHFDVQMTRRLYLFSETNWYHWLKSGTNTGLNGVEGLDLINLGSTGVAGNDIITSAAGVKIKPGAHSEIGVAFEFPVTQRRDIIDNRLTVDWIFRY